MKYFVHVELASYSENEHEANTPEEARKKAIAYFREIIDDGLEDSAFETEVWNEETEKWE